MSIDALLEERVSTVENPSWWLSLLGTAMEDADDEEQAVAIADKLYEENPHPPVSKVDEFLQALADEDALDDYVADMGKEPVDLTKLIQQEEKDDEQDVLIEESEQEIEEMEGAEESTDREPEGPTVDPSPFKGYYKSLTGFSIKGGQTHKGEPCKRGWSAARTGCQPAKSGSGKKPEDKEKEKPGKPASKKPEAKKEKANVKDVLKSIKDLKGKKVGVKQVNGLAGQLASLSVAELQGIKKQLGLKATGKKAELAKQIAKESVKGKGKETIKKASKGKGQKIDLGDFVSNAKVKFSKDGLMVLKKEFNLTPQNVASLVGAPDNAKVSFKYENGKIGVKVDHPEYKQFRQILKDGSGGMTLHNDYFGLKEGVKKGTGIGAEIFNNQIMAAKNLGFQKITTTAAGFGKNIYKNQSYNGYYTWPRFGYDASLEKVYSTDSIGERMIDRLPLRDLKEKFPKAESVLDIMETQEGRDWWKDNGISFDGEFDLSDNSRSLKVLQAYMQERAKR